MTNQLMTLNMLFWCWSYDACACFATAGDVYYSMVRGLLEPLMHSDTLLLRIDVSFGIKKMNLDSAIGRTAHILFLESAPFLRMFVHLYGGYLA